MSESFMCGSWFEGEQTDVGFELSNEGGEQYFFRVSAQVINQNIELEGCHALDKFRYFEEDMLTMALSLIDDGCCEEGSEFKISAAQFKQSFVQ